MIEADAICYVGHATIGVAMFTFLNDAMSFTMRCFPILNDAIFRQFEKNKLAKLRRHASEVHFAKILDKYTLGLAFKPSYTFSST